MRFQCPFCLYLISADNNLKGYKINCPSCEKTLVAPDNWPHEDGCVIGDFVIKSKVGEGSIGVVYKATQISLDRVVALKILSKEYTTGKGVADFLKEARAAAKLNHPNIVQALAVGEEEGTCYLAMTFITGETVKSRLKREGRYPVDEALHIIQQVAESLFYAWDETGLIHRDVKPDNIMITEDGIVKLTDLGLAMHHTEWKEDMEISGSPSYMSPEQFAGEKLDTRSDIYSLGITLYQMLSGTLPFMGETVRTVSRQHFEVEAPALNKLDPKIPAKVAALVKKMIAKMPEDRFADMEELLKYIWTIRQKTAPDKELVPDVHTISIKRLDYGLQQASIMEKHISSMENRAKQKKALMLKLLMILGPVIAIVIIMLFIIAGQKSKNEKALEAKVTAFIKLAKDRSLDTTYIYNEGMQIIKSFGTPKSDFQNWQLTLVKFHLSENIRAKVEKDLREKNEEISKMLDDDKDLASKLYAMKNRLNALEEKDNSGQKNVQKLADDKGKVQEELKKASQDLTNYKNENKALLDKYSSLKKAYEESWMRDVIFRNMAFLRLCKFKEAKALLDDQAAVRGEAYAKFFSRLSDRNDKIQKIYLALTDSGSKYSGANLEYEGRLLSISGGIYDIQEPATGKIKQKNWSDFTTQQLAQIIKDFRGYKENEIKSSIEILNGTLGDALKYNPEDKDLKDACKEFFEQNFESLKYAMAGGDKKKIDTITQNIVRQLEGSPDFDDIKVKIRNLNRE